MQDVKSAMLTGLFKQAWRDNLILSWQFVVALVEGSILSFVPMVEMIPRMLFFLFSVFLRTLCFDK